MICLKTFCSPSQIHRAKFELQPVTELRHPSTKEAKPKADYARKTD